MPGWDPLLLWIRSSFQFSDAGELKLGRIEPLAEYEYNLIYFS